MYGIWPFQATAQGSTRNDHKRISSDKKFLGSTLFQLRDFMGTDISMEALILFCHTSSLVASKPAASKLAVIMLAPYGLPFLQKTRER